MNVEEEIIGMLESVLSLKGRGAGFQRHTPLLGAVPELDSMAVLNLITGLEERFGFSIHDDEIDAETFATVGSLADFLASKLAAQ
ncbi:MAG: phosphopantetheine-binding protein [Pseudomonadota bacterium]